MISENQNDGIEVGSDSIVLNNELVFNGQGAPDGAGVHVTGQGNRIEANNIRGSDRGVDVDQSGNAIIRNSARDNGAPGVDNEFTDIVAGNLVGPVIDFGTVGSSSNPHANYHLF